LRSGRNSRFKVFELFGFHYDSLEIQPADFIEERTAGVLDVIHMHHARAPFVQEPFQLIQGRLSLDAIDPDLAKGRFEDFPFAGPQRQSLVWRPVHTWTSESRRWLH
jgi:hypothetical protein